MRHTGPMTLRDAVEIDRNSLVFGYVGSAGKARRDRARAIVDAAVEAREAKLKLDQLWQRADSAHEAIVEAADASRDADVRLLALERGDEE